MTAKASRGSLRLAVMRHPLVVKARNAALEGFKNKRRKVPAGLPLEPAGYFYHVAHVAALLADLGADHVLVAAAFLHDHPEDLPEWPLERVAAEFGDEVAKLVSLVTLDKTLSRSERAKLYLKRLEAADDPRAISLSAADKTVNLRDSVLFLRLGFPVRDVLKDGYAVNLEKFTRLMPLYDRALPGLAERYAKALGDFRRLGSELED